MTNSVSMRRLFVTDNAPFVFFKDGKKKITTKEASVCAWLSSDHMALTRLETGRMIGEDDDFIPHHMYQLEVFPCCSLCPAAVPGLLMGGQFTKCHKHLKMRDEE